MRTNKFGGLCLFPMLWVNRLKWIEDYCRIAESMFDDRVVFEREMLGNTDELHEDYVEAVLGEIEQLDKDFRFLSRRLIFIKLYMVFEDQLNEFCKRAVPLTKVPFESTGADKGITKVKLYIRDNLNIKNLPNTAWENITLYNSIVNVLKHMDGDFGNIANKQVEKSLAYFKQHPALCKLSEHGHELEVEVDFVNEVVSDMKTILKYIETEMKNNYPGCFDWG